MDLKVVLFVVAPYLHIAGHCWHSFAKRHADRYSSLALPQHRRGRVTIAASKVQRCACLEDDGRVWEAHLPGAAPLSLSLALICQGSSTSRRAFCKFTLSISSSTRPATKD
eukprot:9007-Amphidinium_carterae.1